jgi:MoxR-like ATPase
MTEEIDASNNTGEIARNSLMSRMGTPHREIVLPNIRPRWGKYKASEVEQAFREIAVQVDDLQSTVTQEVVQMLSTIITEVHRESRRVREAAVLEELKMRELLQQDRDQLEQQRQAMMDEAKNEAQSIRNVARQESANLDSKMDEIRKIIAEVSSVIDVTPPKSS